MASKGPTADGYEAYVFAQRYRLEGFRTPVNYGTSFYAVGDDTIFEPNCAIWVRPSPSLENTVECLIYPNGQELKFKVPNNVVRKF